MLVALLIINILLSASLLVGVVYGARYAYKVVRSGIERYNTYVSSPGDGLPSPLETTIENTGEVITQKLLSRVQAQAMATSSHISRQTNAMMQDIVQDEVDQANPVVGMLLNQYPSLRKRIAKNPSALQALMPLLDRIGGGVGNSNGNKPSNIQARLKNL